MRVPPSPQKGKKMEVTMTKTVEFDIELRGDERGSTKPSQVGDEESGI
jgi:hypothetical protein